MTGPDFSPVFIIGSHRSGTSILYRTLAATGCFNVVTAFHVLYRDRLLALHASGGIPQARAELAEKMRLGRMLDEYGQPVSPDTLEEYAYALEHQGRRPVLKERNLEGFLEFCRALQTIQDPARPLLLKNPFDAANLVPIQRAFPPARFVLIHRHPAEIIDSQMRLIRQMLASRLHYDALLHSWYRRVYDNPLARRLARALLSERLPLLFRMVSNSVSRNCDSVCAHADQLGRRAIGITYAQLCERPARTVRGILAFLGLSERHPPAYEVLIHRRHHELLPEVHRRRAWIEARNRRYCEKFAV
jgi:hypothetical protein